MYNGKHIRNHFKNRVSYEGFASDLRHRWRGDSPLLKKYDASMWMDGVAIWNNL